MNQFLSYFLLLFLSQRLSVLFCIFIFSILGNFFLTTKPSQAEIIPDNTLGVESTNINTSGIRDIIGGGAVRGNNLFHSFQEFKIVPQREAYFTNPEGVSNIIGRITGGNPAQIDGVLGVLGNANLFLINPNGIIFGREARLDLQGSFFASTADSILFSNGFAFSAKNPQTPPLLTINVPLGLQMGTNPGAIINQSQTTNAAFAGRINPVIPIDNNQVGLGVNPGQTIALIGGDIIVDNGYLTAPTGNIFLGSVENSGFVNLVNTTTGIEPNYQGIREFGKIAIANNSLLNTSGVGGGSIQIRANSFSLDNSRIYSLTLGNTNGQNIDIHANSIHLQNGGQISTTTQGAGNSGNIHLYAEKLAQIQGISLEQFQASLGAYLATGIIDPFNPNISLITATESTGNAGNIFLQSPDISLRDGTVFLSGTLGAGNGGNLIINAQNLEIIGSGINSGSYRGSTGKGGDIQFQVERLQLRDGSAIGSETRSDQPSGRINITATESVEMSNNLNESVLGTIIVSSTSGGSGAAGDININTQRLVVQDGASINSDSGATIAPGQFVTVGGPGGNITINGTESVDVSGVSGLILGGFRFPSVLATQTLTASKGGDIRIVTPVLRLTEGGRISAASVFGRGDAGNIQIDANQILVSGTGLNGEFVSRIDASVGTLFTGEEIIGNGGSLTLNGNELVILNQGTVSVKNAGSGTGGNINMTGKNILLSDRGKIDATTGAGQGGNITLRTQNLFLRRGSLIQTDAQSANGGNIQIDSRLIVAFPQENSDITANAITGNGGSINITTQGIFGLQIVDKLTPKSDITASSELGVNGVVTIKTFDPEPKVIEQLPLELIDQSEEIAQTCSIQARSNSFTATGRGGIQPNPQESLNLTSPWLDWRLSAQKNTNLPRSNRPNQQHPVIDAKPTLVEANQLVIDESGKVKLVANLIKIHRDFTDKNHTCEK